MAGDFDVSRDEERLRFDLNAYVIGKEVIGLAARHDRVELYLSDNRMVAFEVCGPDIVIAIAVPRPLIETGRVQ
jgi:hypothetical protein